MKKRVISMLLVGMMTLGLFTACGSKGEVYTPKNNQEKKTVNINTEVPSGMKGFNGELVSFMNESKLSEENYMVSPTSFKAALCLAEAGANGQTKDELLKAMGFENEEQMNDWYNMVYNATLDFETFQIANSVWTNEDKGLEFKKEYIKKVTKDYSATAGTTPGADLADAVNSWVNESTNGQIKEISKDLSQVNFVLANALYLKAGWLNEFSESNTESGDFTTISGDTVTKEYMQQTDNFGYYEEKGGKLVILPLDGGIRAAFVLGNISDMDKALREVEYVDVDVKLPKMDIETALSDNELITFLQQQGVESAFLNSADFSGMCDKPILISDIIQKTKIKTDEEGLEAAAVTAIMMTESAMMVPEEREIKEFYATEPFKFLIFTNLENGDNEVLFYGQMVK